MRKKTFLSLLGGALAGSANGLFGGGGGMIAVPYLERVAGYPVRCAHATAMAIVLPATLVSCTAYLTFAPVPFSVLLPVALGVCVGSFAGARLLKIVKPQATALVFAALALVAGVRMLFL